MSTTIREHEAHIRSVGDGETDFVAVCSCGWESEEATCRKHARWLMIEHFNEAHASQCRGPASSLASGNYAGSHG